jgi:hypothetical protein
VRKGKGERERVSVRRERQGSMRAEKGKGSERRKGKEQGRRSLQRKGSGSEGASKGKENGGKEFVRNKKMLDHTNLIFGTFLFRNSTNLVRLVQFKLYL